ncbi:MAG: carboxypeptidase-like regulatory domain-containing protein, partial [Candidatus Latescibacteria bacterium]|nr:carboxypeptidase-like regulatory domain-containing protein [Candidatus Latescibacterota bacterium]
MLGTAFGAVADSAGVCRIEGLPAGRYDVQCSHIGYVPHTLRDLPTGAPVRSADLAASAVALPGVVVSALRRSQTLGPAPGSQAHPPGAPHRHHNPN